MLNTLIGRLRLVGLLEGTSFLLLLCVAMPIKYLGGHPQPVFWVGLVHGILFILFLTIIGYAVYAKHITRTRGLAACAASVIPVGTFVLDPYLRRDEAARNVSS